MPLLSRRWLLVIGPLLALLLVGTTAFLYSRDGGLKGRAGQVTVGMPRAEVEGILGQPVLTLPRTGGRGTALVWVDQFWQVSVYADPNGLVETVECVPSDSVYRRTFGGP